METSETRVVPRPRHVDLGGPSLRFDSPFVIEPAGKAAASLFPLFETLLERETNEPVVREDEGGRPDVRLRLEDHPSTHFENREGYVLDTVDDLVTLRAPTADGLRHAMQTFLGALTRRDDQWTFPNCEIHDWPASRWRGFMLDPARGFLPVERVKRRIDQAARAKLNRLHLHLLDDESYALESTAFPKLNRDPDGTTRPSYSPDDIADIVDYAADRGIEVVPEIDVPAHAGHVLEAYPELRCSVEGGTASDRTMCIGSPASIEFVETLLEEIIDLFPFDVVHVGGDEWAMIGHSWDECVDCRSKMDEDDSETVTEHFYAFVRHLHKFLEDRSRRIVLWNDQIDISDSPDLPRDALIQFWRVAGPDRGPVEGCSMERFLEEEFDVVNSYVHAAYVNGWITEDYLCGWGPRRRPSVPDGHEDRVVGGELLAWEPSDEPTREYFERALPSAIPIFADRLWNDEPITDRSSFSRALTRHALGPHVPSEFDIYRELGGTILPTSWKRSDPAPPADAHGSFGDRTPQQAVADYREAIEMLTNLLDSERTIYSETAIAYVSCLEWLVEVAKRDGQGVIDRP